MLRRAERFAPLMGVLAVVLWVVAEILIFDGAPGDKAPGTEIAAWFDDESTRILVAMLIFGLGASAFIWFLASLAARLRAAEGSPRLPSIVLVAGTAAVALFTMNGIVTAIIAIGLAVAPIGWAPLIFAVPIWTLVTSVWLFATKEPEAAHPAGAV